MDPGAASVFVRFFTEVDVFLLILVRILGFFIILPVFSAANIPGQVRVAFAVVVSYLLFVSGNIVMAEYNDTIGAYVLMIVKEFIVGFATGFVVNLIFSVFFLVGQMIDFKIGFAMVSIVDPLSQIQVPITGNLLYMLVAMLLVASGGLNAFIAAFFYSYHVIPLGSVVILSNPVLSVYIVEVMTNFLTLGIRFAMPVIGAIMIVDVALGVLVKATPQMNFFVVGMPIKLFLGLFVFTLIIPLLGTIYDYVFNEAYRHLINVMDGMAP